MRFPRNRRSPKSCTQHENCSTRRVKCSNVPNASLTIASELLAMAERDYNVGSTKALRFCELSLRADLFLLTWVSCLIPSTQVSAAIRNMKGQKFAPRSLAIAIHSLARAHVGLGETNGFLHGSSILSPALTLGQNRPVCGRRHHFLTALAYGSANFFPLT